MALSPRANSRFAISDPILTRGGDETFGIAKKFLFMDRNNLGDKDIQTHTVTFDQAGKLDVLAEELYGNADLHWIAPMFNRIENALSWPKNGQVIEYPSATVVFAEL
jgi:hypothetical protein